MLLEKTLERLPRDTRVAVLTGDIQTENDANRLKRSGFPVKQITTGGTCHLDARMIQKHLEDWPLEDIDILLIENVGNLVCPSSYDLGERIRVALLSVTEGEDKPLKYPTLFNSADAAVITKMDIAEAVGFDRDAAYASIRQVNPGITVVELAARTGAGLDECVGLDEAERSK